MAFSSPSSGAVLKGSVTVSTFASDDRGAAGIAQTLCIDGRRVASIKGGSLSYSWSTNKLSSGAHTLQIVAQDAAGNAASQTLTVKR